MEFTGIVKWISEEKSGTSKQGNSWRMIEAVIEEENKQYPDSILITQMNDVIDQQRLNIGDKVKVLFSARTNEYNGRYYQKLSCWKVENIGKHPVCYPPAPSEPHPDTGIVHKPFPPINNNTPDDLPW